MKVGNLPSMKTAVVTFNYVIKLRVEETGSASFNLPTVLNPRYNPSVEGKFTSNNYGLIKWCGKMDPKVHM